MHLLFNRFQGSVRQYFPFIGCIIVCIIGFNPLYQTNQLLSTQRNFQISFFRFFKGFFQNFFSTTLEMFSTTLETSRKRYVNNPSKKYVGHYCVTFSAIIVSPFFSIDWFVHKSLTYSNKCGILFKIKIKIADDFWELYTQPIQANFIL